MTYLRILFGTYIAAVKAMSTFDTIFFHVVGLLAGFGTTQLLFSILGVQ